MLLIAPQQTQAWLVSPSHPSASEGVSLCDIHADRISVPFGWTLVDDRVQPKRKRRKKKVEPPPVPDVEALPEPAQPTLPVEPPVDAVAGADQGPADHYVEPEYQFREDGAGVTAAPPTRESTAVTDNAVVGGEPPGEPVPVPPDSDRQSAASDQQEPVLTVVVGDENTEHPHDDEASGGSDELDGSDDEAQGALWDTPAAEEAEPGETTPMLQRAFRVVRDD